jgi:hypothetical protein
MNQDISGILPLLEVQGVAIKEVRQEDLLPRMKWLLNVSKSTPESFYLQLHAEEPPKESFYMLHAAVLALGDPSIMARWLQLEQRVCPYSQTMQPLQHSVRKGKGETQVQVSSQKRLGDCL